MAMETKIFEAGIGDTMDWLITSYLEATLVMGWLFLELDKIRLWQRKILALK